MNTPSVDIRQTARRRQWVLLSCSAFALGLGTMGLEHVASRLPAPVHEGQMPEFNALLNTGLSTPNTVASDNIAPTSFAGQTTSITQPSASTREVPHPITPGHERIFAINRVLQQLKQAVDSHDVPRVRALLAEHTKLEPMDPLRQRLGYERIADCLESPGNASRQAALHFWQTETASPVRRLVRQRCLEGQ